jgi:hypothetical protein
MMPESCIQPWTCALLLAAAVFAGQSHFQTCADAKAFVLHALLAQLQLERHTALAVLLNSAQTATAKVTLALRNIEICQRPVTGQRFDFVDFHNLSNPPSS